MRRRLRLAKYVSVILLIALICLFAVRVQKVSATGTFDLRPPYDFAAHFIFQPDGGSSQATADRIGGTGFVKAQPAAPPLLSSSEYSALASISFITSEWKFNDTDQNGNVTISAQLSNLQITTPQGIPALLQVYLLMEEFKTDGSISNAKVIQVYSASSSHSSPISLHNSTNWHWVKGDLYRTAVFVAAAGAGARSFASSAQADFKLISVAWGAITDFPSVSRADCSNSKILYTNASVITYPSQPIILQGCLGSQNAYSNAKVYLTFPNGTTRDVTPQSGVHTDSYGNFTASFLTPSKAPNGVYLVSVNSTTGIDPGDVIDITFGILPGGLPTLPSTLLIPILAGLATLPVLARRRQSRISRN